MFPNANCIFLTKFLNQVLQQMADQAIHLISCCLLIWLISHPELNERHIVCSSPAIARYSKHLPISRFRKQNDKMQWHTLERFWKWVTQQSSILNLFPSVLETTIWILKSKEDIPNVFNALSKTVTRHWPFENRGGVDMAASDYQGFWRIQVSWSLHHNEPDCTGEWETENWHGWKEMLIYCFFFFKIHVYWLWHRTFSSSVFYTNQGLPSCTDCQFVVL